MKFKSNILYLKEMDMLDDLDVFKLGAALN